MDTGNNARHTDSRDSRTQQGESARIHGALCLTAVVINEHVNIRSNIHRLAVPVENILLIAIFVFICLRTDYPLINAAVVRLKQVIK